MSRGSVTFRRTRDGGKEHCGPAFTRAGGVQSFKAGILPKVFPFLFFFRKLRSVQVGTLTGVCVGMSCGGRRLNG
jgi:hypothetical protein